MKGAQLKRGSLVAGVFFFVSSSVRAQAPPQPTTTLPARDAAQAPVPPSQPPAPESAAPTAQPDDAQASAAPVALPAPATPTQPADDGLEVPATLVPLSPETRSVEASGAPLVLPAAFGRKGQWVVMGSSNYFNISNATLNNSSASFLDLGFALGVDYFIIDNVSLGIDAEAGYGDHKGYGAATLDETTFTTVSGGVRLSGNVPLGTRLSWYPRLTLSLGSSHSDTKTLSTFGGAPAPPPSSESSVGPATSLYAPLLVHPAPHFVVGFGPRLTHDFSVTRGGAYDGTQTTRLSAELVVGGWWGGAAAPSAAPGPAGTAIAPSAQQAGEHVFGEEGQLVLTAATTASISSRSDSGSRFSRSDVNLGPSFDYFFTRDVSIGLDAFIGYTSGRERDSSGATTHFSSTSTGVAPRLGGNLALTACLSLWLRGEIGYGTVNESQTSNDGTNEHSRTRSWLKIDLPLLLHPSSHFFVGLGPFVFHELSDRDQYSQENDATALGASLLLGGWFGVADAPGK